MSAKLSLRIDGEVRLPLGALPRGLRERLSALFTFPNPARVKNQRNGRPYLSLPQWITGWREEEDWDGSRTLVLPRGALADVEAFVREAGLEPDHVWMLAEGERLHDVQLRQPLRDYQQAAVRAMVDGGQGLVVAPCGAGKTQIGVGAIVALGRSALVLIHTQDLLEQWVQRLRAVAGIEAGVIGGGRNRPAPVTVATVQTLTRWPAHELRLLGERFGVLVVDECHHGPARTYWDLIPAFAGRRRFGLTATPERDDGLTPMLGWLFGRTLYQIHQRQLLDGACLVAPEVVEVRTEFEWAGDAAAEHTAMLGDLALDRPRNQLIVDLVGRETRRGGSVLVLSQRKEHCQHLSEQLERAGVACRVLNGDVGKVRRRETLELMREGALQVLIATQLADEGLDIPRLSALVLAMPQRAAGKTVQRLGRIMRPAPGKGTPRLYDLVDVRIGVLQAQARARRRAYRQILGGGLQVSVLEAGQLELEVA